MEVRGATGANSSPHMGLYQWTHERSNGRQVYKHETNDYYLYHTAGTGGTWWIGTTVGEAAGNDTVGEAFGWLYVDNESAERPDEISGGWQEGDGKAWAAAAGVTVVARAHIGRGVTASSIKVIDDEQAAKANAAAAAAIAAVAAAAAHAAATTVDACWSDRMEAALLALRLPPSTDSAEAAKQRAEVGGMLEAAADGDGTVTAHELASVASQLGLRLPSPLPDALLKLFCDEGQGQGGDGGGRLRCSKLQQCMCGEDGWCTTGELRVYIDSSAHNESASLAQSGAWHRVEYALSGWTASRAGTAAGRRSRFASGLAMCR
jgi:hypothetical protein